MAPETGYTNLRVRMSASKDYRVPGIAPPALFPPSGATSRDRHPDALLAARSRSSSASGSSVKNLHCANMRRGGANVNFVPKPTSLRNCTVMGRIWSQRFCLTDVMRLAGTRHSRPK